MKIFSYPPISNGESKILILGTMPGNDSLKYKQYYAHPRNSFWKIMFDLFNEPFSTDYTVKKSLLLKNKVALWDVLKACERQGSLDANICKEEANDLNDFFQKHPKIDHIFFNGSSTLSFYKKYGKGISIPHSVLPSTSPAHAISFDRKLRGWSVIKEMLISL